MTWKRKENKYLGVNNLSDKETKENKELKSKPQIDQYLMSVPEHGKYLGLENVSKLYYVLFNIDFLYRFIGFKRLLRQFRNIGFVPLHPVQGAGSQLEAIQQRQILPNKRTQ